MRVLATRPEANNPHWTDTLKRCGFEVQMVSLLAIRALDETYHQTIRNHILALDSYNKAVFVSQNAVYYALKWIDRYWPQLPVGIEWYGIGEITQKHLQHGLHLMPEQIHSAPSMNSEGLLSRTDMQALDDQKIIIFRGLGGRTRLADTLGERGAEVAHCELYERSCPCDCASILAQLSLGEDDIVPVFSAESLENFKQACADIKMENWSEFRVIVPGARVAEVAKKMGFKRIFTAANASENAMLNTIKSVALALNTDAFKPHTQ